MIEIVRHPQQPPAARLEAILQRRAGPPPHVEATVAHILQRVREEGDDALAVLSREIEGVALEPGSFRVGPDILENALRELAPDLRRAMETAVANIRSFHRHQQMKSWFIEDGEGVILGKKVTPVRRVGVCAPAGEVPLFSSLFMAVIPAQVAGVEEICVVSPPRGDGLPHPRILAAARLLGVPEVYALGGAQGVAAMAYGTASVPAVDVIVGPGSPYTVAAQRQVFGVVGIPLLPGPSEIVVVADERADPRLVAADMLSQAEHGWGVASVCITPSAGLAEQVAQEADRQLATLPRREVVAEALEEYGAIVVVPDLEEAVGLLNQIAPEHAELMVVQPWEWLEKVRNCGAVFMGPASAEAVGDYFAGTNHILPTNGAARYASSLGVRDFLKTTSIVCYGPQRLNKTGAQIATLARAEDLEAHARAVQMRLDAPPGEQG